DFNPSASYEMQTRRICKQVCDLGFSECFAIECHVHLEVEKCFRSDSRSLLAANSRRDLRSQRATFAPVRGHPDDDPGGFQHRQVIQKLECFTRSPPEWMKDLTAIHHRLQPCTLFRCPLYRQQ